MAQPEEKLIKWIRKQLTADVTEDGLINRFDLYHSADGLENRIASVDCAQTTDADDLAADLSDAAETDAGTRSSTPQRYVIAAFRAADPRSVSSQYPFILKGGAQTAKVLSVEDTYPPTERGERGLSMTQNAEMHRLMFQMSSFMAENSRVDVERERRLRMRYEDRQMELMSKLEELNDRKHERDLERAQSEQRARMHDKMMGMLMAYAPILLEKLAGVAVGGKMSLISLTETFKNLSEKEVMGIIAACEGENQHKIIELYRHLKGADEKDQAEKHPLLRDPN